MKRKVLIFFLVLSLALVASVSVLAEKEDITGDWYLVKGESRYKKMVITEATWSKQEGLYILDGYFYGGVHSYKLRGETMTQEIKDYFEDAVKRKESSEKAELEIYWVRHQMGLYGGDYDFGLLGTFNDEKTKLDVTTYFWDGNWKRDEVLVFSREQPRGY